MVNIKEDIKESLRSIKANMLRSVLTALIVSIGITALVGILTAVEGIKSSVTEGFSGIGTNTFTVTIDNRGGRQGGRERKEQTPIKLNQARSFKQRFNYPATVSIISSITGIAEVKYGSKKTNPNIRVTGIDENYLVNEGIEVSLGRNISSYEAQQGSKVALIGKSVATTLFGENINPLDKEIGISGNRFQVVGVLEKEGGMQGGGADRQVLLPLASAVLMIRNREPAFEITVNVNNPDELDPAIAEATGIMRRLRNLQPGQENDFVVERSEEALKNFNETIGIMRVAAFVVSLVTLFGCSIALMNIMMVSVTERTREIGLRKAVGATPKRIRRQFLVEAIVICLLGGALGVLFGIMFGNGVSILLKLDTFVMPWVWIFVGLTLCVLVGLLSGLIPAIRAARLDPIDSLRYE
ncbi:ABC transporter permease [Roseivirga sp. BDSF3-8]|uniref:ABC transporter permease n=1 Tax=Roseivirga sp. BDSF3-8 TaxID=3241598 RepID=UPI0035324DFC